MNETCKHLQAFDAWFDLSSEKRAELVAHAEACDDCRPTLVAQRELEGMVSLARDEYRRLEAPDLLPSANLGSSRVQEADRSAVSWFGPLRPSHVALGLAAAVLLWIGLSATSSLRESVRLDDERTRQTGVGQEAARTAKTGQLDPDSSSRMAEADGSRLDRTSAVSEDVQVESDAAAGSAVADSTQSGRGAPATQSGSQEQVAIESRLLLSSSSVSQAVRDAAGRRPAGPRSGRIVRAPKRPQTFNFRLPAKPSPHRAESSERTFGAGEER